MPNLPVKPEHINSVFVTRNNYRNQTDDLIANAIQPNQLNRYKSLESLQMRDRTMVNLINLKNLSVSNKETSGNKDEEKLKIDWSVQRLNLAPKLKQKK